jgi:hypothetical protein
MTYTDCVFIGGPLDGKSKPVGDDSDELLYPTWVGTPAVYWPHEACPGPLPTYTVWKYQRASVDSFVLVEEQVEP